VASSFEPVFFERHLGITTEEQTKREIRKATSRKGFACGSGEGQKNFEPNLVAPRFDAA